MRSLTHKKLVLAGTFILYDIPLCLPVTRLEVCYHVKFTYRHEIRIAIITHKLTTLLAGYVSIISMLIVFRWHVLFRCCLL